MFNITHKQVSSYVFALLFVCAFFGVNKAEAAIVLDGTASDNTDNTTSVVVNVSGANIDDDDLILFMGAADGLGYAMPSGFTEIARVDTATDNVAMGYKVASSEPTSYTVNTVSGGERGIAIFAVYSGVDTLNPINATTTSINNGVSITIGSVTPDNDNSAVVVFVGADSGNDGNPIASSWPSTVTEQLDNVNGPPGAGVASMSGAFGDVIQTTAATVSGAVGWGEASALGSIVAVLNEAGGGGGGSGDFISGTVYQADGVTNVGAGVEVKLAYRPLGSAPTSTIVSTTTSAGGAYAFDLEATALAEFSTVSTPITVWVAASSTFKATTFTKTIGDVTPVENLNLYQDVVQVESAYTSGSVILFDKSLSYNSGLSHIDSSVDADILYTTATSTLELSINDGATFRVAQGATVTKIASSTFSGDVLIEGQYNHSVFGTTTFAGSDNILVSSSTATSSFGSMAITGDYTLFNPVSVNNLTVASGGTLSATGTVEVLGNVSNNGSLSVSTSDLQLALDTVNLRSLLVGTATTTNSPDSVLDTFLSSDGSKLYNYIGGSTDVVNEYALSIPWDVSSASFTHATSIADTAKSMTFSSSGDKMFFVDISTFPGDVTFYEYSLDTPWDVSSANFTQSEATSTTLSFPFGNGLAFSDEGTAVHVVLSDSTTEPEIFSYTLSTPWDISTLTSLNRYSSSTFGVDLPGAVSDLDFSSDGLSVILVSNDLLTKLSLTTPFDMSTATYEEEIETNTLNNIDSLQGLVFIDNTLYFGTVFAQGGFGVSSYYFPSSQTLSGSLVGSNALGSISVQADNPGIEFLSAASTTGTFTAAASTTVTFNAGDGYTFQNIDWQGVSTTSELALRSSAGGSQWALDVPGSQLNLEFINVQDSDATDTSGGMITASSTDSGNNLNWSFGATGAGEDVTISGTLYQNDGVTPIGAGRTIVAAVGTSTPSLHSTTTDGSGNFSITGIATSTIGGWATTSAAGDDDLWKSVTYGNGLFVAVGGNLGGQDRVMTSPDGITWTARTAAGDDDQWTSVTYGNGLFVAVGLSGDRVMTSPDGITWATSTAAGDNDKWRSIAYGNGLFVAVSNEFGAGDNVMTSPDGITWTARTAAGDDDAWFGVTYGNDLFVAVGDSFNNGSADSVMTSPDGINWATTTAAGDNDAWQAVTYGNGVFVAISEEGDYVMTSPDGTNWTVQSAPVSNYVWYSITHANDNFVAVGFGGSGAGQYSAVISPDGANWATTSIGVAGEFYNAVTYGNGRFVAVADSVAATYADAGFGEDTPITLFVDGETEDATTVIYGVNGTSTISGIDLYQDTVRLEHSSTSGSIDLSNADFYDASDDADILFTATTSTTTINADLIVDSNTTLVAPQHLDIDTDLTINGVFAAERGEVLLTGGNQTLTTSATTTFYDFTAASTSARTLTFNSGEEYVFSGELILTGADSELTSLDASTPGSEYFFRPNASATVEYLNVQDSYNISATTTPIDCSTTCVDGGNTSGWSFPVTTLTAATTSDPASFTIAPGSTATVTNAFALVGEAADTITEITIAHSNASSTSLIEIISDNGATVYGSTTTAVGTSTTITLDTNISVTTSTTTYKIRITPKTHANLPSGNRGALIPFSATVLSFDGANTATGTDQAFPVIIDNQSLAGFGVGSASTTFATTTADYTTGEAPEVVAAADFNNDGYVDFVIGHTGGTDSAQVFLNDGDGTFTLDASYTTGASPRSITTADFNNDGYEDFVVANSGANNAQVFLNDGDGTFTLDASYNTGLTSNSITTADFNNDGYEDFVVVNAGTDSAQVFLNDGDGTFTLDASYTTGASPRSITTADFNNDGYVDFATVNIDADTAQVFLNDGDGTFTLDASYVTDSFPRSLTTADFNNDGYEDFVVVNEGSDSTQVFLNDGDGTFTLDASYTTGSFPFSITTSDFNNDGYEDFAVAHISGTDSAQVFLNDGDGTFTLDASYTTGASPYSITTSDFNNDGYEDFAVVHISGTDSAQVFQNQSTTTLSVTAGAGEATISYTTPPDSDLDSIVILASTSVVTTAPVDGTTYTGSEDIGGATVVCVDTTIATSTADSCTATSLTNDTPYYFTAFVKDTSGNYSFGVEPAGSPVTPEEPPVTTLTAATTSDPATFTIAPGSTATVTNAFALVGTAADTITEITIAYSNASSTSLIEIVSDNGATVYGSTTTAVGTSTTITLDTNISVTTSTTTYKIRITPKTHANLPSGNRGSLIPITTTVLDWSGAGTKVGTSTDTAFPVIIDNLSLAGFGVDSASTTFATTTGDYTTGSSPNSITTADFNNDGYIDFVVTHSGGTDSAQVFLNDGDGTFTLDASYVTGDTPQSVTTADFNNDGYIDFVVTHSGGTDSAQVFLNDGDGTFTLDNSYVTNSGPVSVTTADFDNDGYVDFAVANYGSVSAQIFLNDGDGTFTLDNTYTTGSFPVGSVSITTADFNNDGYFDLAVVNVDEDFFDGSTKIFLNDGDGTFTLDNTYTIGDGPGSITTADLNNDGYEDFAVVNGGANNAQVFLGDGDGTFTLDATYVVGFAADLITASDFNNDGYVDFLALYVGSTNAKLFLNDGDGTFTLDDSYTTGVTGSSPQSLASADINNDGLVDFLATYSGGVQITQVFQNQSTTTLTATTTGASGGEVIISYTTPPDSDLDSIVILASTSAITTAPVDGTTYTGSEDIGGATVVCVDTTVATSTADSCTATGLTGGTPYYFTAFVKDTSGNYSFGVEPAGSPVTPEAPIIPTWNSTDWTLYDTITIDATNIDDDLTDFPVYVDLADLSAQFWSTTPTGTSTVGTDIRVTTNDGSPVELPRELVAASSTAQTGELHFKANSISSTTDTIFRIYYNGTTTGDYATDATYGAENVWSNDYFSVYHFEETANTTAGGYLDSTVNSNDATGISMSLNSTSSPIGGTAAQFDGVSDYIDIGTQINTASLSNLTVSAWVNQDSSGTDEHTILSNWASPMTQGGILFRVEPADDTLEMFSYDVVGQKGGTLTGTYIQPNVWGYAVGRFDVSNGGLDGFSNDVKSSNVISSGALDPDTPLQMTIGKSPHVGTDGLTGSLDEVRIASTSRSEQWVAAEYLNQSASTDFYAVNVTGEDTILGSASTTDPVSFTVAPGSTATVTNAFTFKTTAGTDEITAVTIAHANASSTSLIEVISADGVTVYGSTTAAFGTSTTITLSTNTLTASTSEVTYKIRITPKNHVDLPSGNKGRLIPFTATVLSWVGTAGNAAVGNDQAFPVVIDNQSSPTFAATIASSSFATKIDYPVNASPRDNLSVDVNNDGYVDVVVVNWSGSNLSVLINNGDGTFATKADYTVGANTYGISFGDYNNDGYEDIVAVLYNSGFSLLLNNGDGTFAAKVDYLTSGTAKMAASADINNDGYTDVIVSNWLIDDTVSVLINNGDGTFAAEVSYATGDSPHGIVPSDLDNDGYLDLAIAFKGGTDGLTVLLNNGDGTFAAKVDYTGFSGNGEALAVGDLDQDNYLDVVIVEPSNDVIAVYINNGDGSFASRVTYPDSDEPADVQVIDFNNDGYLDVVSSYEGVADGVSVFMNDGDGTFAPKQNYLAGVTPKHLTAADYNNDGFVDLAISNATDNDVSVFLSNATTTLTATTTGASGGEVIISYTTPPDADLDSIVILASTSAITTAPTDGTTYTGGEDIGGATVACVDSTVATSTADSCTATGLTGGTPYYFTAFVKDTSGNYSFGVDPVGSPVTPELANPIVTVSTTTNITRDSATLNGEITAIGGEAISTRGFRYSTSSDFSSGVATTSEIGGPYKIDLAIFDSIALDVSGEEGAGFSMLFNDDGTILYVLGTDGVDINAYPLDTPYDISSYSSGTSVALDVSGEDTFPMDMIFNNNGTTLYVLGGAADDINAYPLDTPYDISSYSAGTSVALDVSGLGVFTQDMLFNDDGSILYVLELGGDDISAYPLDTPYDISSYSSGVSLALNIPGDADGSIIFNNDGTTLYVLGSNSNSDINAYPLDTPYDISSYSSGATAVLDVSGQEIYPKDILFNDDGTILYVLGTDGDDINAYTIPTYATGTYTFNIDSLNSGTTYYVQAFAENNIGLSYSTTTESFTTILGSVEWNATDYTLYDTITIDATNIDDDLTDFPVYVDLADLSAQFWSTTPTGTSTVGTDIRVTTNDGSPVELSRELVAASSTAQTGELHFKANSISSTTDTIFRIYYNGTTTGDYTPSATYGAENVWSNYTVVWHMDAIAQSDSAGNLPDAFPSGDFSEPTLDTEGNVVFDANDGIRVNSADEGAEALEGTYTDWSAMGYWDADGSLGQGQIAPGVSGFQEFNIDEIDTNTGSTSIITGGGPTVEFNTGLTGVGKYLLFATYDSEQDVLSLYYNGNLIATTSSGSSPSNVWDGWVVSRTQGTQYETRGAQQAFSSEYIKAQYINFATTTDFYTTAAGATTGTTTLTAATASDPASFTIAPGSTATVTNAFALVGEAADTITEITIAHQNASSTSLIEIVSDNGATVYGSTTTAVGTSTTITLDTNISVTTSTTTYKIRITPKTHANLPSGNMGSLIPITTTVLSFDGANTATGTDQAFPVIIDNLSLAGFGVGSASTTFATTTADYTTGSNPRFVTTADFNNDGYEDFAVVNQDADNVQVFLNDGDGTFTLNASYTTGDTPLFVTTADFNNDGYVDFATANYSSSTAQVFLNDGDGTFTLDASYTTASGPISITTADFNNDGYVDFAVVNSVSDSAQVFLNDGDGTFTLDASYTTASGPISITTADFNNDGYEDFAVVNQDADNVQVFLNDGDGTFTLDDSYATGFLQQSITPADFNNDGYVDFVVAISGTDSAQVFLNDGDGTFTLDDSYVIGFALDYITTADFNNDGYEDFIAMYFLGSTQVFLNDGDGTFTLNNSFATDASGSSDHFTPADFNNDGLADFVAAYPGSLNSAQVYQNQSVSTLTVTASNTAATISYTTPPDADLDSIVILRSTSTITDAPVDGTTYTGGETIGGATVACVDSTIATSTADSCTATGLTNGTPYYFTAFVKDTSGNYSFGVEPVGSPVTPELIVDTTWNATDYTLYDTITIDATNIDDDLTDFPVYVDLADLSAQFWSTTPTGTSTVGTDIRVTTNDGSPVELPRELVWASSTAQTGELHFKANSISSTTDTIFRIYYNGTTTGDYATDATYGAENVWSNGFIAVYHLKEDGSITNYSDSTSNANTAITQNIDSDDQIDGQLGVAVDFDSTAEGAKAADNTSFDWSTGGISGWLKTDTLISDGTLASRGDGGAAELLLWFDEGVDDITCAANIGGSFYNGSSGGTYTARSIDQWLHGACFWDGTTMANYVNAVANFTTTAPSGSFDNTATQASFGLESGDSRTLDGAVDEVRFHNTARSAEWVSAEYLNQSTTTDFYTTAAEGSVTIPAWNATDWTLYDTITIASTSIDATLTDFPVYVDLADLSSAFWNTTPAGASTVGTDIRVTTNDGSPVELPRELVWASSTAQTGELHFKANSISSTTDTVFRIYYNGTTTGDYATSSTYGAQNVWTNDYVGVWHLQEDSGGGAPQFLDSSANGHDASGVSLTATSSIDAVIGKGVYIGTNQGINFGDLGLTNQVSLSMLFDGRSIDTFADPIYWDSANKYLQKTFGNPEFGGVTGSNVGTMKFEGHFAITANVNGTTTQYQNGSLDSVVGLGTPTLTGDSLSIPLVDTTSINGYVDEVRVVDGVRSAAWIAAENTNQNDTGFYSVQESVVWNPTTYTLYDTITIDATNIDDDLTDFPVYVDLADLSSTFWATTPTGSTTVGTDIRVTTNDGSPVELPRELVAASSTAQTGELHFKANSISSTTNTVFRIYYNGNTVGDYLTDATYGAENVWSNDFVAVWHLDEVGNTTSGGYRDSSGNGNDGTGVSLSAGSESAAKLGRGQTFDNTADYITIPDGVMDLDSATSEKTLQAWISVDGATDKDNPVISGRNSSSGNAIFALSTGYNGAANDDTGYPSLIIRDDASGGLTQVNGSEDVVDTGFRQLHLTRNASKLNTIYIDGASHTSGSDTITAGITTNLNALGAERRWILDAYGTAEERYLDGSMDEVRIASTSRTAAWISAEYTNQSTTTDFYTIEAVAVVAGSSSVANHEAGQVDNAFNFQNKTNEPFYAFQLTPESGNATVTALTIDISGAREISVSDFSNLRLFRDLDNDAAYDVTDQQVGGAGVMTPNGQAGTITFSTDFLATTTTNYLVTADWNYPARGSQLNLTLHPSGVSMIDANGAVTVTGTVDSVQHSRLENRGGGGGSSARLGDDAPAGDGEVGGGTNEGGERIGNDPDFYWPNAAGGFNGFANGLNAVDKIDGTYATDGGSGQGWFWWVFGEGDVVPASDTIEGIEVLLELSAAVGTGTIDVRLSWDGSFSFTTTKTTPVLSTTDTVVSLGGASDTWGRTWSPSEFADVDFAIYLDGSTDATTIRVDAIQVKVYHQSSGGSGGGGGRL